MAEEWTCPRCKQFEGYTRRVSAHGICEEQVYPEKDRFGETCEVETSGMYFKPVAKPRCMKCSSIMKIKERGAK